MRKAEYKGGIMDEFLKKQMMVIEVAPEQEYIVEWGCLSYINSLIRNINHLQWEKNNLNSTIKRLSERLEYLSPNDYLLERLREHEYLF